jgi:hypothetical protein
MLDPTLTDSDFRARIDVVLAAIMHRPSLQ